MVYSDRSQKVKDTDTVGSESSSGVDDLTHVSQESFPHESLHGTNHHSNKKSETKTEESPGTKEIKQDNDISGRSSSEWYVDDGLEDFQPAEYRWPQFNRDDKEVGNVEIKKARDTAKQCVFEYDKNHSPKKLEEAIKNYGIAAEKETARSKQDFRLKAFACVNLGILLTQTDSKNERRAVTLFKRAAQEFELPAGMYFYGYSRLRGFGGIKRDVPIAVAMLNQAGSDHIGEAFFVLGSVYERGVEMQKDIPRAEDMYKAAERAYRPFEPEQTASEPLAATTNCYDSLTRTCCAPAKCGRCLCRRQRQERRSRDWRPEINAIKALLPSEDWHCLENDLSSQVGERFSWSIAGQAFLFGAAAAITVQAQPEHYPPLLPILPILGFFLALFSVSVSLEANLRNIRRRRPLQRMLEAKLDAFERILEVAEEQYSSKSKKVMKQIRSEKCKLQWRRFVNCCLRNLAQFCDWMAFFLNVAFLLSWTVLLALEVDSKREDCGDWWETTCQGSESYCNSE